MTNERTRPRLSIVPPLELREPSPETHELLRGSEPSDPVPVTLRLDRQALDLLTALASHDETNPAEQIRTATTIYIRQRLGDQAVRHFITEREEQLQQIRDTFLATTNIPE